MNYFEDFQVNQRITFGRYKVTQAEIINFATQYDPQVFHVDEDHPLTEELGGILASGWHSTAIFMRLAVDAYLGSAALLTSPGVDELRWLAPVRAGGIYSFDQAEALLANDKADIVGFARQALADPDWFEKVRRGQGSEVMLCRYSNYCEGLDQKHKQVTCELWDREKLNARDTVLASDRKRRLTAPQWTSLSSESL